MAMDPRAYMMGASESPVFLDTGKWMLYHLRDPVLIEPVGGWAGHGGQEGGAAEAHGRGVRAVQRAGARESAPATGPRGHADWDHPGGVQRLQVRAVAPPPDLPDCWCAHLTPPLHLHPGACHSRNIALAYTGRAKLATSNRQDESPAHYRSDGCQTSRGHVASRPDLHKSVRAWC